MVNWDAVGAIGEIAGALAVVVTLIFLSRQIRETARQITLASATEANSLFNEAFAPIYNNDHNMRIWVHGLRAPESLSEEDRAIFLLFMSRLMGVFDTVVDHHEQLGTLESEKLASQRGFALQFLETPGGRAWAKDGRYRFSRTSRKVLGLD
ncbi:MAG: hypothetical protein ACQGVC_13430 [Myxococcota bacterium]